jgi:hypothetical protein
MDKLLRRLIQEKAKEPEDSRRNEVTIIKGQINKAENTIEKWFEQLTGSVIAELDFVDKTTFGYLDSIPRNSGIRIITSNIKDVEKCVSRAEKCAKDRPFFKIVEMNKIHQRWIGSKVSFFVDIGTDLKSDALGHCTHAIRKIESEVFKESISLFEKLWKRSEHELRQIYGEGLSKSIIYSAGNEESADMQ